MITWKDTTSYSQNTKERVPRSWTWNAGVLSVIVHRHIDYPADTWLVSVRPALWSMPVELGSKDLERAKQEAVAYVRGRLSSWLESLASHP